MSRFLDSMIISNTVCRKDNNKYLLALTLTKENLLEIKVR